MNTTRDMIRNSLAILMAPGDVLEVRIPKVDGKRQTDSGYFDNPDMAATEAARYDGRAAGVYFTLNPCHRALLARAANRIQRYAEYTTQDDQIERRRWLLLDFDSARFAGISTTDAEHAAAHARAHYCRDMLRSMGWPEPVYADSGNGAHLLYGIDLPNNQHSTELVKRVLEAIAARVNDDVVKLDTGVYNAARIVKLYGTLTCKGDNTPERPHRRSGLLEVPSTLEVVPADKLLALAAEAAPQQTQAAQQNGQYTPFDMEAFIKHQNLAVSKEKLWYGGTLWELEECPYNADHKGTAHIGQRANGAIHAGCFHNSCQHWGWAELRAKLDPSYVSGGNGQVLTSADDVITTSGTASQNSQNSQNSPSGNNSANSANSANTPSSQQWQPPIPFYRSECPPFPSHALPDWLREYVRTLATATQTPEDLPGMLVLASCAVATAKKVEIVVRDGFVEPVNIFVLVVLPPGTRKTVVFKVTTAPLLAWEQEEAERMAPVVAEAETQYHIMERRLNKARDDAAKAAPEDRSAKEQEAINLSHTLASMQVPALPRLIADDVSPERLATLLRDQGGRMAVMSPEGDLFDIMAGRYSSAGTPNFGVYLKGHAGDTVRVDRVGRPSEFVKAPALTLALTVQPDVVHGLATKPGFRGRGLLGRKLYALPAHTLGTRDTNPPPVPPIVQATYHQNIRALLALPFGTDERGMPAPHMLCLDPAAQERMQQFEQWVEPQLGEFGELGGMTDWGGKLVGAVARITALLHMATHATSPAPWAKSIQVDTVENAITIGKYLIPHAKAAYAEMGADPVIAEAQYLWRCIERKGVSGFTKRDAFEWTKGHFKKVAEMEPALTLLADHGFIRQQPLPPRSGPGQKPSPVYEVNPLPASQNSHYSQNTVLGSNSANSTNSAKSNGHAVNGYVLPDELRETAVKVFKLYTEYSARQFLEAKGVPQADLDAALETVRQAAQGVQG